MVAKVMPIGTNLVQTKVLRFSCVLAVGPGLSGARGRSGRSVGGFRRLTKGGRQLSVAICPPCSLNSDPPHKSSHTNLVTLYRTKNSEGALVEIAAKTTKDQCGIDLHLRATKCVICVAPSIRSE